jgi:hypothetical protein
VASGKCEISEAKGYQDIPHPGNYRPMLIGTDISIPAGGRKTPRKSSEYYYMDSKCKRAHSGSYNTIIIVLL